MKQLSRSALFLVFLGAGIMGFAQVPGQRRPPSQQPGDPPAAAGDPAGQAAGDPLTVTGCLMKGASSGDYAITDSKSGEKFSFAAPDKLQQYLNQTVQLTGTVTNAGGAKAFRPESVRSVSPSCGTAK
jgi:hypothetical protein